MERPLDGIRVLEVAQWWFVPSAGAKSITTVSGTSSSVNRMSVQGRNECARERGECCRAT